MVQTSMLLAQALSKGEPAKAWHHVFFLSPIRSRFSRVFFPPVFCEALNMLANLESTVCHLSYITFVQNCERCFGSTLGNSKLKTNEVLFEYPPLTLKMARCYLVPRLNGGREVFWNSSPIWREENSLFQAWFWGSMLKFFGEGGFLGWFFFVTRNLCPRIWGNIPGFCAAGRVCDFRMWLFPISLRWRLGPWKMPGTLRSKSCGPTQPA